LSIYQQIHIIMSVTQQQQDKDNMVLC